MGKAAGIALAMCLCGACFFDKSGTGGLVGPDDGGMSDGPVAAADADPNAPDADPNAPDAAAPDATATIDAAPPPACEEGTNCVAPSGGQASCAGGECTITCDQDNGCTSGTLQCAPGRPCNILCTGSSSCAIPIDCSNASSCLIECTNNSTCDDDIICGPGPCTVSCTGNSACQGSVKDCSSSCSCDWDCGSDGCGNGDPSCPHLPACDLEPGCTSDPGFTCDFCIL